MPSFQPLSEGEAETRIRGGIGEPFIMPLNEYEPVIELAKGTTAGDLLGGSPP